jgi:hypothetical protein
VLSLGLFERLVGRDAVSSSVGVAGLRCAGALSLSLSQLRPPPARTLSSTEMRELTSECSGLARG